MPDSEADQIAARVIDADEINALGIDDLLVRLRFSPKEGRIWLDNQRMALVHLSALSVLRRRLVDACGFATARSILTQMGYTSGSLDADIARRVRSQRSANDVMLVGPQLHALEGMTSVHPIRFEMDVEKGHYDGEATWNDSAEADAHIALYGLSADPVCWMQLGYASGYMTAYMGRQIEFREVECRGMGAPRCRIVGKPMTEWSAVEGKETPSFPPEVDTSRRAPHRHTPPGAEGRSPSHVIDRAVGDLVGASPGFVAVCQMLAKVARTDATVLLLGETGVGKGMFAKALHRMSRRAERPFIAVNCAAIPENLVEAELFGVEKGAFTGAVSSRPGRFERADGGTLFLDEIGILNFPAQGKLLRALQECEIERLGGTQVLQTNVRLIAASNEDLERVVKERGFREDLFFRLNVFPIRIPPLRERKEDIPVLIDHFLNKFNLRHGRNITGVTERAVDALLEYAYPGNIRELENMIERGIILADGESALDINHLFAHAPSFLGRFLKMDRDGFVRGKEDSDPEAEALAERILSQGIGLESVERALVNLVVARSDGNLAAAGRTLNMSRAQIAYRLKRG